ncbi:AMP-binding protein, partial [bacterium]|nr:AMP-binding protein [bacterium]
MNIYQGFQKNVEVIGDQILAKDPFGEMSYQECHQRSESLARVFANRYAEGSHIAFLLPSVKEVFVAVFSAMRANMVSVPLNFLLTPPEILKLVHSGEVKFIFTTKEWGTPLEEATRSMGLNVDYCFIDDLEGENSMANLLKNAASFDLPKLHDGADKMALLLFTSGTTAFPKGVMLSHQNIIHNVNGIKKVLKIQDDDKILGVLPYFHTFALTGTLFLPSLNGCSVVLVPRFKPALTVELLKSEKISLIALVPSMYRTFLSPKIKSDAFTSVRTVVSGGEALPVTLAKVFHEKFGKVIMEGYGMTETAPVISVNDHQCIDRVGTVGQAITDTKILILDEDGNTL